VKDVETKKKLEKLVGKVLRYAAFEPLNLSCSQD
jgi:hypothetical protein